MNEVLAVITQAIFSEVITENDAQLDSLTKDSDLSKLTDE